MVHLVKSLRTILLSAWIAISTVGAWSPPSTRTGVSPARSGSSSNCQNHYMLERAENSLVSLKQSASSLSSQDETDESLQEDIDQERPDAAAHHPLKETIQKSTCITGVTSRTGPLNEAVARIANMDSLEEASRLIEIGAVWAKMDVLNEDDILSLYDEGSDSIARNVYADLKHTKRMDYGENSNEDEEEEDLDQYIEQMTHQRFRRILSPCVLEAGTDVRIYPQPRRFPSCAEFEDPDRILYEDTTFLVVDKPPMLPTQPDASNYNECCPGCVQTYQGPFRTIDGEPVTRPLLCHRVDACVGGCVVMSKDQNGQKVFQEFQRDRKLRKVYLAVTKNPVPLGMHIHWMWSPQNARGQKGGPPCQLISHATPESRRKARQFWTRCVLEVTKCEPIYITDEHDHYNPGDEPHYQATIRLVTGRKHQVRAQLASLGCPIIGDTLYEPISGLTLDKLETAEVDMDTALSKCRVPTSPIALQAHAILFGGIRVKARTPWWGNQIL